MSTQIIEAQAGNITEQMSFVAKSEGVSEDFIREKIARGRLVILNNNQRKNSTPKAIGEGVGIKVASNISNSEPDEQADKIRIIEQTGADILMDLSDDKDFDNTRKTILSSTKMPIGTTPIYQSAKETYNEYKDISNLSKEKIFSDIEKQCQDGVDFISVHCGLTKSLNEKIKENNLKITSKGGLILSCYIEKTKKENPLFEYFDELLDIARTYDTTICFAGAFKLTGAFDELNSAYMTEILTIADLVDRAQKSGVQAMVEAPEIIMINQIQTTIQTIKKVTHFAPLYSIGPNVTNCSIGHSHIGAAIGGTIAGLNGVDLLLSVPSAKYLKVPNTKQIKESIIVAKIAAHSADIVRGNKKALELEEIMTIAKNNSDINAQKEFSFDKSVFTNSVFESQRTNCPICNEFCSR